MRKYTEVEGKTLDLLLIWKQQGIAPLTFVRGYADLCLKGAFGPFNKNQANVIQEIFHQGKEVIESWHEFVAYFRRELPVEQIITLEQIGTNEFNFLQHSIIDPALSNLENIVDISNKLIQEAQSLETDEQREAIIKINNFGNIAIERWREPINYFTPGYSDAH